MSILCIQAFTCRFIPACAGNSRWRPTRSKMWAVHPRVCGELGSNHHHRDEIRRFIPACAGNSGCVLSGWPRWSVHPRVCGELPRAVRSLTTHAGSSPRVRGTLPHVPRNPAYRRFIPACAGNSLPCRTRRRFQPVHPRVCGELTSALDSTPTPYGSSPRVRGTRRASSSTAWAVPVHPRVCGELVSLTNTPALPDGSSPRVRGTLVAAGADQDALRFIPACAGNSAYPKSRYDRTTVHPRVCGELLDSPTSLPTLWQVHPRVCGELGLDSLPVNRVGGSSPRVRGTRA